MFPVKGAKVLSWIFSQGDEVAVYVYFIAPLVPWLECRFCSFLFFPDRRWTRASSPDPGLEQATVPVGELGAKPRAPAAPFGIFIRNLPHLCSQVLQVTCREYSKAMSEVSLGLTAVRKSCIKAAQLLSASSPTPEQTLCKHEALAEGDERWGRLSGNLSSFTRCSLQL